MPMNSKGVKYAHSTRHNGGVQSFFIDEVIVLYQMAFIQNTYVCEGQMPMKTITLIFDCIEISIRLLELAYAIWLNWPLIM